MAGLRDMPKHDSLFTDRLRSAKAFPLLQYIGDSKEIEKIQKSHQTSN